jgi:3-phenylpropionate/trans-cinnamate dioxygenase ferredoxin reductase subunit
VRVEHEAVAQAQGAHVAAAMLGSDGPYREVPYFWTDLADWASLEYVGAAATWDREVVRGSMDEGSFCVMYADGDRLVGCAAVDRADDLAAATKAIGAGGSAGGLLDP